ncbi:hypothetical protein M0R04_06805 [Candidatus Dojkabacteria bacterium]|jgi:hypothetical protein|nr:hypothetical protein [Candidatus Dojkabacteria bacterium]
MKQRNYNQSNTKVLQDIKTLSIEDLSEQYDIHITEHGTVWDPAERKCFAGLLEWAEYIIDQNDDELYGSVIRMGSKKCFDDGSF